MIDYDRGALFAFINFFEKSARDRKAKAFKQIVIAALGHAIKISPIDTGLYRANHHVSFGVPDPTFYTEDTDEGRALEREISRVADMNEIPANGVFMQNNLVYAEAIENGWSDQAPQGVYSQAKQIAEEQMSRL